MTPRFGNKKRIILMGLVVLGTIPVAGAITMIVGLWAAYELKDDARKWKRAFYELERDGYLKYTYSNTKYSITTKGIRANSALSARFSALRAQKNWDGILRVVIFDVPVSDSIRRRKFRKRLKSLGFIAVQKSVYVHKSPCEDRVAKLASSLKLSKEVIFMESSSKNLLKAYQNMKVKKPRLQVMVDIDHNL